MALVILDYDMCNKSQKNSEGLDRIEFRVVGGFMVNPIPHGLQDELDPTGGGSGSPHSITSLFGPR